MKEKPLGFVGVGRMGANMARRLSDLDYKILAVYDMNEDAAQAVAAEIGAAAVPTPAEVTAACEIVITVVSDDQSMLDLFSPKDDCLLAEAEGRVFINCATVSPAVHEAVAQSCAAARARALEASMASSITQAREGTLYLMVAGEKNTFEEVQPLLDDLAADLQFIGPTGTAAKVKALVNMVMNINTAGLAEGLGLGEALGLDLDMLRKVFSRTGANSRVLETDGDDMVAREHECYFSAAHAAKDSGIANALAHQAGISVPLSVATEHQYRRLVEAGKGELDKSAVAELTFRGRAQ